MSPLTFYRKVRLIMSLDTNLTNDLDILDADLAAAQLAAEVATNATAAKQAAIDTEAAALADQTKADSAQAAQLAKVKADLDAIYG